MDMPSSKISSAAVRKGMQTRATILQAALAVARQQGLEGLTIGVLAQHAGMSKSGVFAHFGSREELQVAVLREYQTYFVATVLKPAVQQPRGLARLQQIFTNWLALALTVPGGCLFLSSASEYDDRPGPVREVLVEMIAAWQQELATAVRQSIENGDLPVNTDTTQLLFELYGLVLMSHHQGRLLGVPDSATRAQRALQACIKRFQSGDISITASVVPAVNRQTITK